MKDLWYRTMAKIRRETSGMSLAETTAGLPPPSKTYERFLHEGPRRGDGAYALGQKEKVMEPLHKLLPKTTEFNRMLRMFGGGGSYPGASFHGVKEGRREEE